MPPLNFKQKAFDGFTAANLFLLFPADDFAAPHRSSFYFLVFVVFVLEPFILEPTYSATKYKCEEQCHSGT